MKCQYEDEACDDLRSVWATSPLSEPGCWGSLMALTLRLRRLRAGQVPQVG